LYQLAVDSFFLNLRFCSGKALKRTNCIVQHVVYLVVALNFFACHNLTEHVPNLFVGFILNVTPRYDHAQLGDKVFFKEHKIVFSFFRVNEKPSDGLK
jgi:hypothetical protein